jgi:hypothetical protein
MPRPKKNKSQLIRDYKAKHPEAKPAEIVAGLKAHKISYGLVGNVLHNVKAKHGKAKKKHGRKPSHNGAAVNLQSLLVAKKLIEQLGGIEHAKSALSVLEKLG